MKKIFRFIVLRFQMSGFFPSKLRAALLKLAGVKISNSVFIGQGVVIDTMYPHLISIGYKSAITYRSVILTHFVKPLPDGEREYPKGPVIIGDFVFIGAHVVIVQSIIIGDYSFVAAGSVITKSIPPGEIWGGVPAKFIKKRELKEDLLEIAKLKFERLLIL